MKLVVMRLMGLKGILLTMALVIATLSFGQRTESYKLKIDDLIRVQVFNQAQIAGDIPVGVDGFISPPFLLPIRAEGKTLTELQKDLISEYKRVLRLRDPIVSVTILRFRAMRATVGGAVNAPGQVDIRPGDTVITLLNSRGGYNLDRADLRRATLKKASSNELIPLDLHAMLILGDQSQNYEVEDGDELNIPEETRNRILVMGTISRPGAYPYKEPMRVSDAIAQAGGELRTRSRMSKILVIREKTGMPGEYERFPVDFVKFIKKGDSSQNLLLRPGDFVYVSETNTPDFNQVSALANVAFILDRFGSIFGFRLFSN